MKHLLTFVLLTGLILSEGCATFQTAKPKPMVFKCALSKTEFLAKAKELLMANRFVVDYVNEDKGEIEADRVPSYTGIGENLVVKGPYVFNGIYNNGTVTINIQTVHDRDGKPVVTESHNETSDAYDRTNYMIIINGLKNACAGQ
jgi:hypothetical protein